MLCNDGRNPLPYPPGPTHILCVRL
ncbi:hypothetical protein [Flavitalea sp. BT771]